MHWIAPSEKDALTETLEKRLGDSANQFRANSGLKAQEAVNETREKLKQELASALDAGSTGNKPRS